MWRCQMMIAWGILAGLLVSGPIEPRSAHAQEAETAEPVVDTSYGDALLAKYFQMQTARLSERVFAGIETLEDWEMHRDEFRRQLFEMLGLDPMPERTPLEPVVTGTTEHEEFVVERLHFQSMPGLYVTGNLYRPKEQDEPLPAILYVCGHGRVKKDGISYGNKASYQHHGGWFARHGYVCLMIDTIQLGEIEGMHHGTYRHGMWWWNNRGYTPAGVEAWNGIRALDYLQSRPEVDGDRLGVTGRSGGGAYSWWVAALDERIKAAVPVAGITSMQNHVVDGCIEGHCDCMYMVNTYQWDFPLVAALVAPRPLLISNTDKDRIFPLDGVVDVYTKVREIYSLYDAEDKLGLHITEGPHLDTQELRIHAFRWMNRHLRDDESLIEKPAVKFFEPEELKVFEDLPADERVTDIHETFVPRVDATELPSSRVEFESARDRWMLELNEKVFRGWPTAAEAASLDVTEVATGERNGIRVRAFEYTSQQPYRLHFYVVEPAERKSTPRGLSVVIQNTQEAWESLASGLAVVIPDHFERAAHIKPDEERWERTTKVASIPTTSFVYCVPRGIGFTEWDRDERERTHIRRRFMLLGQTVDAMRIYDVRRALQALDMIDTFSTRVRHLHAGRVGAAWATYASLYEDRIEGLHFYDLPTSHRDGPFLLNVNRYLDMPQVALMAADRVKQLSLTVSEEDSEAWNDVSAFFLQEPITSFDRVRIGVRASE